MASSPSSIARPRRLALLAVAGASTIVLTVAVAVASSATASRFAADVVAGVPFSPTEADGLIPADAPLTVENDEHPAMTGLDPTLRDALRAAQQAATADGIVLDVTSGWRSDPYQRWLLEDAIRVYGSEDVAREYVAAPEDSSHIVGEAVDIGSLDAQLWLIDHGRAWGLCQTYANERWHFERATSPGGDCPAPHPDARG